MNTELAALKTVAQIKKYFKARGHAMIYGNHILASNRIWNDEKNAYNHYGAIFDILTKGTDDAHTPVALAAESDETFADQGHAFAWAISMCEARD